MSFDVVSLNAAVKLLLGTDEFSVSPEGKITYPDDRTGDVQGLSGFQAAYDAEVAAAASAIVHREMQFRDFMDLFTEAEQMAIMAAAQVSVPFALWIARAQGGPTMSLDHPDTAQGLQDLVDAELLTAERRSEVLAHQPT